MNKLWHLLFGDMLCDMHSGILHALTIQHDSSFLTHLKSYLKICGSAKLERRTARWMLEELKLFDTECVDVSFRKLASQALCWIAAEPCNTTWCQLVHQVYDTVNPMPLTDSDPCPNTHHSRRRAVGLIM